MDNGYTFNGCLRSGVNRIVRDNATRPYRLRQAVPARPNVSPLYRVIVGKLEGSFECSNKNPKSATLAECMSAPSSHDSRTPYKPSRWSKRSM